MPDETEYDSIEELLDHMKKNWPEEYEVTKRILKETKKGNAILPPSDAEVSGNLERLIILLEDLYNVGILEKKFYYQEKENKLYTISTTGKKVYEKLCYT